MNMYQKLKEQFRKENSIIRTVKNKDKDESSTSKTIGYNYDDF